MIVTIRKLTPSHPLLARHPLHYQRNRAPALLHNARITQFRVLAENEKVLGEDSKRNAQSAAPGIWDWFDEVWGQLRSIIPDLESEGC